MRKIAIFQSDLSVGGIQKSLINLLNRIDLKQVEVDLYLFDDHNFFKSKLPKEITVYYLKKYPFMNKFVYFDCLKRFTPRMRINKDYDMSIDFNGYWNECAIGALSVNAKKRVMWIHNDVAKKREEDPKYRMLWHFFKGKLKHYDEFVAVSSGVVDSFRLLSKIDDKKITVIPNYINAGEILEKSHEPIDFNVDPEKFNLVTMGRLNRQKGFDILIDDMAEVVKTRRDIRLYLIGDGPEKEALRKQIDENGLAEYVTMLGSLANPFPYLKQMDGFALTSRYEGQGMVIWEAKALGLQLFLTKNLEKYNENITGSEDIVQDIIAAEKREKKQDLLFDYNEVISHRLKNLMES